MSWFFQYRDFIKRLRGAPGGPPEAPRDGRSGGWPGPVASGAAGRPPRTGRAAFGRRFSRFAGEGPSARPDRPERRSGLDRRSGLERRASLTGLCGLDRRSGLERRAAAARQDGPNGPCGTTSGPSGSFGGQPGGQLGGRFGGQFGGQSGGRFGGRPDEAARSARPRRSGGAGRGGPDSARSFGKAVAGAPAVLAAAVLAAMLALGCSGTPKKIDPVADPALRALGGASMRVIAERLESPLGEAERAGGGPSGPLHREYVLDGRYEGRISEALLAISAALGYGLIVEGPRGGDLAVVIEPRPEGGTVYGLIKDLNRQLRPLGAVIGVDVVNRRLSLFSGDPAK